MEGPGSNIDNLKALIGFKKLEKGFDPNKFEAARSLVATLDNRTTPPNDKQARDLISRIDRNGSALAFGLDDNASVNLTLKTLRQLQSIDYNSRLPNDRAKEARALANRLVSGNLSSIDRAIQRTADPTNLQLAMDLVKKTLREDKLSPDGREIDFLLRHFEEGLRSDDSREDGESEYTKYSFIASDMFIRMDENQRIEAIKMLQGMIDNPEIRGRVVYVISHLSADQWIPDETREEIRSVLTKQIINQYGLDYDELLRAWVSGSGEILGNFFYNERNLNQIFTLESTNPGICKTLKREFRITNFSRYPEELLIDLFQQRNNMVIPYGLMLYPKRDHDGTAYLSRDVVKKFYEQLKSFGYSLRLYEVGSKMDIGRVLIASKKKFGIKNKIEFMILVGHGNPQSITFGETYTNAEAGEEVNNRNVSGVIHQLDFEGSGVQKAGELLADHANIILVSCSTGAAEGIAKTISETYPKTTVTAPEEPTDLRGIDVTKDAQGKLHFKVAYRSTDISRSFAAGKSL
ncbi:hypothetical protein A2867_05140 [Candidatus Daviesbacteria bacterium RIFCSPHIGHO2_01_FULL_40_11]|uniref:Uncharacterized protein n=3 Tax=Bacteria candidate phyla TaxID=1783234 RepID=A0A1F5JF59_9BACT|nr:MAG: hypothetical protein A3A69_01950 [candidate division WWE3 bacterium RIFCSPLOWO2_01_FULL_37_15]OGE27242.1 MAG: hypothetical protein A2867_05140 [Candidatus Daviesbacteria bacterium RIFCSPHIGHO2_01_FULL_40_11]